jgi:hypothetical protein
VRISEIVVCLVLCLGRAHTANGQFSVRSAYFLDIDRKDRVFCSSSCGPQQSSILKTIWKLQVPRAVQLFLWRACNDILPTKDRLLRRKVVSDPLCPLCGHEAETTGHVLWTCDAARAVWAESPRTIQKCAIEAKDFCSILKYLRDRLSQEDLELVAMIAQRLWTRRNQWVFEGTFVNPKCLISSVNDSLFVFRKANAPVKPTAPRVDPSQTGWIPPAF